MTQENSADPLIEMTADIVSAYLSNSKVALSELPGLIQSVFSALSGVMADAIPEPVVAEIQKPAVPIRKSITPDFLISLEDGRQYKSLKRHLRTAYNMSPEDYRAKWKLPRDYPMVAPAYAARRSALAKAIGLGRGGAGRAPIAPAMPVRTVRKPRAGKVTEAVG
jgi:predicted transcriptional regulator